MKQTNNRWSSTVEITPIPFACGDHSETKRHWRALTDNWRAWPALRPDAISVRCKRCATHLIVYGNLEAGGGTNRAGGAGANTVPPSPASLRSEGEVFVDPEPTVRIRVLPEVH